MVDPEGLIVLLLNCPVRVIQDCLDAADRGQRAKLLSLSHQIVGRIIVEYWIGTITRKGGNIAYYGRLSPEIEPEYCLFSDDPDLVEPSDASNRAADRWMGGACICRHGADEDCEEIAADSSSLWVLLLLLEPLEAMGLRHLANVE